MFKDLRFNKFKNNDANYREDFLNCKFSFFLMKTYNSIVFRYFNIGLISLFKIIAQILYRISQLKDQRNYYSKYLCGVFVFRN